jgi:hypothetical protein
MKISLVMATLGLLVLAGILPLVGASSSHTGEKLHIKSVDPKPVSGGITYVGPLPRTDDDTAERESLRGVGGLTEADIDLIISKERNRVPTPDPVESWGTPMLKTDTGFQLYELGEGNETKLPAYIIQYPLENPPGAVQKDTLSGGEYTNELGNDLIILRPDDADHNQDTIEIRHQYRALPQKLRDAAGKTMIIATTDRAQLLGPLGPKDITDAVTNFHTDSSDTTIIVWWGTPGEPFPSTKGLARAFGHSLDSKTGLGGNLSDGSEYRSAVAVDASLADKMRSEGKSTPEHSGYYVSDYAASYGKTQEGKPGQYTEDFAEAVGGYVASDEDWNFFTYFPNRAAYLAKLLE